jgi:predicted PurR-regulated permease PerM
LGAVAANDEHSIFLLDQDVEGSRFGLLGTLAGLSWRFLVCVIALTLIVVVLIQLKFVVIPLLLAILFSSVLSPLTGALTRRGLNRGAAATLTVFIALGVLVGIVILALPPFISHIDEFRQAFDSSGDEIYDWLAGSPLNLDPAQIKSIHSEVDRLLPEIKGLLVQGIKSAVPILGQGIAMVFLSVVLTGYLLHDGRRYWEWVLSFISPNNRPPLDELGENAYETLAAYLQGTAIIAAIYAVGITLANIVLGVDLAVTLGIVVFFLAFLPIIGAWASGALVLSVAFASGGFGTALAMGVIMIVLSEINSIFVRPRIVGQRVALVPVVTLTTVLAGTAIAGVMGGILAVPVVATISGALGSVRRWRAEGVVPNTEPPEARYSVKASECVSSPKRIAKLTAISVTDQIG